MVRGRFSLVDHHGRAVTEQDYRGRLALVYFGFTHCEGMCPRALDRLTRALDALGARADAIEPLYISVDPARDTPAVLKAFLEARYPRFTGLTGSPEQIDAAKHAFRVFAERKPDPDDPDGYSVPDTEIAYLVGPDGQYLAHFTDAVDEAELSRRLQEIAGS